MYGHGESSHEEELYYLNINGDDLIWFVNNVIKKETVVCGHSNGALTAGYVAAYGGDYIKGVVLEEPPVFSTQGENCTLIETGTSDHVIHDVHKELYVEAVNNLLPEMEN